MEAIHSIFDQSSHACTENDLSGSNLTVEERSATFRGRSPFTVYIKRKPGQYTLKIKVCADTETVHVLKLQVHTSMTDGKKEVNQGKWVVMDLVEPYFSS